MKFNVTVIPGIFDDHGVDSERFAIIIDLKIGVRKEMRLMGRFAAVILPSRVHCVMANVNYIKRCMNTRKQGFTRAYAIEGIVMYLKQILISTHNGLSPLARGLFACFIIAVTGSCGAGVPESPITERTSGPSGPLPALPAGSHLGAWISYEDLPPSIAAVAESRLAEMRAAGSKISRVHVGWDDLEPNNGAFNLEPLKAALARVPDGDALMVLIETIDSEGLSLPSDLVGDDGGYSFAPGRRFGDAVINQRFATLLQKILPLLTPHKVFAFSVANEPDNFFDGIPLGSTVGSEWQKDVVAFLSAARTIIRSALPNIAVGVTLAQKTIEKGAGPSLLPILQASDVALFNYYCQDQNFRFNQ